MTAFQKIARSNPPQIFTHICGDCDRRHHSASADAPHGWALIAMDCSGAPFARCPDCASSVAKAPFDRPTAMHPPKADHNRTLSLQEHSALTLLSDRAQGMTWEIARACGYMAGRRCLPQVRNMLRRLERWGYVHHAKTPDGFYATYSITDAGRRAVQP